MSYLARHSLHYGLLYLALGAILPYLPVFMAEAKGLTGAQIGLMLAGAALSRVVAGPLIAAWSAGRSSMRGPALVLSGLLLACYVGYGLFTHPVALVATGIVAGIAFQSLMPFGEAAIMLGTRTARFWHYGRVRAVASGVFIVASLGAGALMQAYGPWAAYGWMVAAIILVALSALLVGPDTGAPAPADDGEARGRLSFRARFADGFGVFRVPGFLVAMLAAGLIQASHGFYYAFSSNLWIGQGVPESLVGVLWSTGVVAEIAMLLFVAHHLKVLRPETLLLLGGVACVLRWTAYAFAPPFALTLLLQATHAATFGVTLIGGVRLLETRVAPEGLTSAQVMCSALVFAPLYGLMTLASGPLFDAVGATGYLVAAATALAGVALVLRRGLTPAA